MQARVHISLSCVHGKTTAQPAVHITHGVLYSNSLLYHLHFQMLTCNAAHPSMLTGLGGGRRAYQALTWLGVDPAVPRLGLTSPIQEFQG